MRDQTSSSNNPQNPQQQSFQPNGYPPPGPRYFVPPFSPGQSPYVGGTSPQQPYPPFPPPLMYPPPYPYPGYPGHFPQQTEAGSGMAVAGFTLGIISLITWIIPLLIGLPIPVLGIIFSALGLRSTSRRTMATIGLVLSILGLTIHICDGAALLFALLQK
jgi:hypothetical protein